MSRYKYPHTPHLPASRGKTEEDITARFETLQHLQRCPLVVTEKMDGGNFTMYPDGFHSRSLDSGSQPWDYPAINLWSKISHLIPEGWRLTGESMYAERSIRYENLPGVFLLFGVWDTNNMLLSWEDTETFAADLNIPTVPVLYKGDNYMDALKAWGEQLNENVSEGFVLRNSNAFHYDQFQLNIAKMVRANHVRTDASWRQRDDFKINGFQK